jgi:hypothetical protein
MFHSLASFLLSHQHQPECVPYTTVCRSVWCTVSTDKTQLKTTNIKTIFKWKIEGRKEAVDRLKLSVHEMYLVCVH